MTMTADATARAICHRVACAQTYADVLAVGDSLGVDRDLPLPLYIRRLRWRVWEMRLLATSQPHVATGRVTTMN